MTRMRKGRGMYHDTLIDELNYRVETLAQTRQKSKLARLLSK